jgi:hypothetical protein
MFRQDQRAEEAKVRRVAGDLEVEVVVRWATTARDQADGFAPLSEAPTEPANREGLDERGYGHGV